MKKLLCLFITAGLLLCTACTRDAQVKPSDEITNNSASTEIEEPTELTLYFPDRQGLSLVGEETEVVLGSRTEAEAVVEKLIEGPQSTELLTLIPEGTELLGVTVDDGLCTVDFSGQFTENSAGGTSSETLCVYSIVNSLTELEDIDEVLFLINGETVEIFGNFIFDEPFEADGALIKKQR